MRINDVFQAMVERSASDGFITVGAPVCVKVDGQLARLKSDPLNEAAVIALIDSAMTPQQQDDFRRTQESNFALHDDKYGRFRASAFVQRGLPGMVLRRISDQIPSFQSLGLPPVLEKLSMLKRGLVIFVGATGTGKSTSLAAMIDYRNRNSDGHIVTIEDPIEFVHEHHRSLITQREVGLDTESYQVALSNMLRQAPDVIMIGEVRSAETMQAALSFAETGHLCLCTLHATNANQALERIQSFFPHEKHNQVWMDLSLNLKAMIAQQLLPQRSGNGRVPIIEVLLASPLMQEHIRKGEVHLIKELMARSTNLGMQTFDQSLLEVYKRGQISQEQALRHADSPNDLRLQIKLHEAGEGGVKTSSKLSLDNEIFQR